MSFLFPVWNVIGACDAITGNQATAADNDFTTTQPYAFSSQKGQGWHPDLCVKQLCAQKQTENVLRITKTIYLLIYSYILSDSHTG